MRRFYAAPERFHDNQVTLDKDETYHLVRVLRLGVGARVEVCDGGGGNFEATVAQLNSPEARLELVRRLNPWGESPLPLILGVGLAKGDALDGVIRQATEMGVGEIIPFVSERSERPDPSRAGRRLARWQRLARESLKSCQRCVLPQIVAPREFSDVLAVPAAARLIFWEDHRGGGLRHWLESPRPHSALLLIGPEGGFAAREVALAREAGFQVASLGPRRLKVETAALAALTLLQYAWGDLA
jgi:16S rRNA (uracil1498-N3)-methyltransferase